MCKKATEKNKILVSVLCPPTRDTKSNRLFFLSQSLFSLLTEQHSELQAMLSISYIFIEISCVEFVCFFQVPADVWVPSRYSSLLPHSKNTTRTLQKIIFEKVKLPCLLSFLYILLFQDNFHFFNWQIFTAYYKQKLSWIDFLIVFIAAFFQCRLNCISKMDGWMDGESKIKIIKFFTHLYLRKIISIWIKVLQSILCWVLGITMQKRHKAEISQTL